MKIPLLEHVTPWYKMWKCKSNNCSINFKFLCGFLLLICQISQRRKSREFQNSTKKLLNFNKRSSLRWNFRIVISSCFFLLIWRSPFHVSKCWKCSATHHSSNKRYKEMSMSSLRSVQNYVMVFYSSYRSLKTKASVLTSKYPSEFSCKCRSSIMSRAFRGEWNATVQAFSFACRHCWLRISCDNSFFRKDSVIEL